MVDEEKDRQLEALLDSLLRTYSAAEPRPGFETRLRAVVGEQSSRPRRINWLMLAASAAAVALFAWMMLGSPHRTKAPVSGRDVAGPGAAHDSTPAPVKPGSIVTPVAASGGSRRSSAGRAEIRSDTANRIVLQMAEAAQGSGSLVFEREKLYLNPERPSQAEAETETTAVPERETQAPAVSIESIGVASIESNAPIEIKDLAAPKSSTEKGSL